MLRPGDRLGQRYEVIEQIAAGGMGTLWRAHHVELDVDVALKVVSAGASTPASLKRFKREAQAAAKLRSPNIVQVLDYGEFDGKPFLAMELLRGEDLAARIARERRISLERCSFILDGVARAVQLAHDAGIVHRDLKPGNIFLEKVGDDEVVKILDFGIAKDLGAGIDPSGTTGAGVVGSPAYMSPEQVWAKKVGVRADVWAMGVVAFEMLSGKNPFHDKTLARIFERIIRDPLPKLADFGAALSPELDRFFERALARAAAERIASPREFAEQFRSASAGVEPPPPRALGDAPTERVLDIARSATTQRRSNPERAALRRRVLLGLGASIALGALVVALASSKKEAPSEARLGERDRERGALERPASSPRVEQSSALPLQVANQAPLPEAPAPAPSTITGSANAAVIPQRPTKTTRAQQMLGSSATAAPEAAAPPPPLESSAPPPQQLDPRFGIPMTR